MIALASQVVGNLLWSANAEAEYSVYEKHYVLIAEEENEAFWDNVYESACERGKELGVYVERFGTNLPVRYSRNELLSMAIRASVDGIIVQADGDEETIALINEAEANGIPVITVMRDASTSDRQAYVGINNYSVGQAYGEEIIEQMELKDVTNILVLANSTSEESEEAMILMGIRETVSAAYPDREILIESGDIDTNDRFAMEEYLRAIFVGDEEMPDFIVCLDGNTTVLAYQAALDFNQVGEVSILGSYDSENILTAVENGILECTLSIDTVAIGESCVEALVDYEEYGYMNTYRVVDFEMLNSADATARLSKKEDE